MALSLVTSADPFAGTQIDADAQPVWLLEDVLVGRRTDLHALEAAAAGTHEDVQATFIRYHERQMAQRVLDQRRKLPPLLNSRALFTKAAPFNDPDDVFYHSPTNRIAINYTLSSKQAASVLFEEFSRDSTGGHKGTGTRHHLAEVRSAHSSNRPLSPSHNLLSLSSPVHKENGHSADDVLDQQSSLCGKRSERDADGHAGGSPGAAGGRATKFARTGGYLDEAEAAMVDAVLRYFYYVEAGIDVREVAPYVDQWLGNALAMVPPGPPSSVSQEFYDNLIQCSVEEVRDDYEHAMKKAIVDYVISSDLERQRLGLTAIQPLLEIRSPLQASRAAVLQRQLPPSWHLNVTTAREEIAWTLQILSPNALELTRLWVDGGYAGQMLLDLDSDRFRSLMPMQADSFKQYQTECSERVKAQLWTNWVPKAADIFHRIPPVYINNDSRAYYRSIATLQSNQLRSLVSNSLESLVTFFRRYKDAAAAGVVQAARPVFDLELTLHEGTITFSPTFQTCKDIISGVLDFSVHAVAGLPQLGADLSTSIAYAMASNSGFGAAHDMMCIPSTQLHEDGVVAARAEVMGIMDANAVAPAALAAGFEQWLWLVQLDAAEYVERFAGSAGGSGSSEGGAAAVAAATTTSAANTPQAPSLEQFAAELTRLLSAARAIRSACHDKMPAGIFTIRCAAFKEQLASTAEDLARKLMDHVRAAARSGNERIVETYMAMQMELSKPCSSGEDVLNLKKLIQKYTIDQEKLKEAIAANKKREEFLVSYRHLIPEEDFEVAMKAYEWPRKMVDTMREASGRAVTEHREFETALKKRRKEFGERVESYTTDVTAVMQRSEVLKRETVTAEVVDLNEKLLAAAAEAEEINVQERMFGWAPTKYGGVAKLVSSLEPHVTLWTTINQFYDKYAAWMNGPFVKLNPEEVEAEANEAYRKLYKLTKTFSGTAGAEPREGPLAVAEEGKAKVQSFQAHIPLITAICNPGLRERHWQAMADIVGFEIKRDEVTSLRRLLDNDISEHLARVTELSDAASREWSIEKALDKMAADWEGRAFELGPWKATGTYILKGGPLDEATTLLEDHLVKAAAMAASPFSKPFEERLGPWEKKLRVFQDILDEWLKCQGKWIYLEPIFGAEEIMKQIPTEGQAFRGMDATWREVMAAVVEQPLMMAVAEMDGLLDKLRGANEQLDVVEKGLNDFLDTKKLAFPRFFFLSNDELLEILSECKDPRAVQPFVKKCFEAVKELVFEEDGTISGMVSVEGEKIAWGEVVDPAASGAVERWLLDVERVIKQTLHSVAGESLAAYATTERDKWIRQWPGQLVLNCSQVYWTREVTEAIQHGGSKGLTTYGKKCTLALNKIVSLVRSQISSLERATCGALVVIDVHARDVVAAMAADGVETVRDFKWQSQMRYYWELNEAPPSGTGPKETLMVRMINAEALYGYEYLGNSGRLVITPLTDRCYRTLMGAIHMNLGGAPAGPAGTGKTETTKDLSKALAVQCVVFNCSDGLDYKAMGKFFKGLACCGAWACFDEFNRIELEVLSVVAQQVLTIIRAKAAKVKTFMFEGTELGLLPTCNVFITMNPGYAGRSELPDNLKALFRDVAMMVPDYAMIAEIMLYSYGYLEARALARKLVQTYRLCSEQLSSQDHYDYGMRAVMSVLRTAGNLKRGFPDSAEDVLMLRAINDVNLPKFLDQDVPLFNGILSDLFPGVTLPSVDYDNLRDALVANCARLGLQPLESFLVKSIQLYEMILVRHGLMLVGQSYGMKTAAYRALAGALTDLAAAGKNDEQATKCHVLNPKSVTMGQLYGQEDPVSKEWTDGVLAVLFRNAARDTSPDRKWIIFDGPVDAIWIENMNTVLDDNKKLCLNSGEIIAMQGLMNLIFEVQDLAVASPATVSRCGMVYVQPDLLGWRPVLTSWLATLPAGCTEQHKQQIVALFEWLVPPCLRVALKLVRSTLPMQDINLVASCMRILEAHLDDYKDPNSELATSPEPQQTLHLQSRFLFALVWSIGGLTDEEGRKKFDTCLRKLLAHDVPPELANFVKAPPVKLTLPFPEGRTVYDFVFDSAKQKWVPWMDTITAAPLDTEAEYTSIIVPTVDTVRYTYLLDKLVTHRMHCLFVGPTGTGKTAYVKRHLQQQGLPDTYLSTIMTFSAQTSVNTTQDIIDGKLDKRRRGVYGPPVGKNMVIFVDDLNMPQVEEYGAQPPIELLRQFMDHGGWYDRKELAMRRMQDVQFVAAMGPPGGGRNAVTNRYLRHFSVVSMTAFDNDNLTTIFSALVDWWLRKYSYGPAIARLAKPLVAASLEVYSAVQAHLLPTPTKSHYMFNLRDMSKVFQCITKAGGGVEDTNGMVRLWTHEVLRVFYDRLISDEDRLWLGRLLGGLTEAHFKEPLTRVLPLENVGDDAQLLQGLRGLMFGDFMNPGSDVHTYAEIKDQGKMLNVMSEYLSDYNATSKKPMQLVMFQFALEHVARIARIITSPGGNALLVGMGGAGRQSLTRLAAFIEEYEVFQIEISKNYGKTEWHEDLKRVLRMTGEAGKKVVFLFADTQIREESFVEDISNLLNTYEVPNLMQAGDLATIFETMRPRAKAAGMDGSRDALYNFFVLEVRANLHVVLSFSPVGDAFRERLRKFPSLVNCTTIDWFTRWPRDALHTVATNFLSSLTGLNEQVSKLLPDLCVLFHDSTHALSTRFLEEQRRHYYVTPTSYLELLLSYKTLLGRKQSEVVTAKQRYEVGLDKLQTTEVSVTGMQAELIALQPQLEESTRQTEAAMQVIARETTEADKVRDVVEREEASASAEAAKVKAIADECSADLAEALPALEAALKALDTLTKNDITEVKGMKSPPAGVKLVLEAVCILRGVKPIRIKDATSGRMVDDYWEASKKMLMEDGFLDSLRAYDKDHIEASIVKRISPYIENPEFQPDKILNASRAAYGLCCWVRAMESYDRVAKVVEPKRAKLAESEAELKIVMTALRAKQAELKQVLDKLDALSADLADKQARKAQLERDVNMCSVKLGRAQALISGLGGEKARWTSAASQLGEQHVQLTGDVLLAAAQIAYLGPFTMTYRADAVNTWVKACQAAGVPCNPKFRLEAVLGDPVKIRQWNIQGLPRDEFSTENSIAVDQGRRWPLCIDPQGLANKWIRAMHKEAGLLVIKLTDGNYLRTLENAIQFGKPVLLENVGEALDAALEPLLQKQTFKQGGALCIKLGDATVEYSEAFKFYITTKLRNPHYAPELCTKVSLLNFMTTPEGLEDQLLGLVVIKERPDLEEEKNKLIITGAENKRRLKEIEDEILRVLSSSEGNILEDENAVNILQSSKLLSDEISSKQRIADETEAKIDVARAAYKPVAHHSSILYFATTDLGAIDPMYQYSLRWFVDLYTRSIAESQESDELEERLQLLNEHFTYFLFQNVCRSLFEKDKLLFAFMLLTRLRIDAKQLCATELWFVMNGGVAVGDLPAPNPAPDWVSDKMWGELCRASQLPNERWRGLREHVAAHTADWKRIYDSREPQSEQLPQPWQSQLDAFQRLVVLRAIRPDKLIPAITAFVAEGLGQRFIEPMPFALEPSYADSNAATPLIFVLSPGSDPMLKLLKFAEDCGVRVESVSLGQGQGPVAQKWIDEGVREGFWVVLQNCHLAKSFLPKLELICEQQLGQPGAPVHPNFRLWLTSYPSSIFPISILENGIKMTNEAPKGLRAGLLRTYSSDPISTPGFLDGCAKDAAFRSLLFGLAFFHSVVQERRRFGPIGWNIPYEFNENDLRISCRQLRMFLDEYAETPFDTLSYTAGECNYGGKVTDAHDRHTLMTVLSTYYTPKMLLPDYKFSPSGIYYPPANLDHAGYLEYINSLPLTTQPEVFGLHENADIAADLQATGVLLDSLMSTQSREASAGGKSAEQTIADVANDILARLPGNFDVEVAEARYPQDYYNSMNTVLVQELVRINALLSVIRTSLTNLGKAVKGLALMSSELDTVGRSLFDGRVPGLWLKKSFPSVKPLGGYIKEVLERVSFFQSWIDRGAPSVFWISGFFFTQAFLTGSKQNFARKHKIPIDQIEFDFEIKDDRPDYKEAPRDGVYCRGLFLEGARWDYSTHELGESEPKVLYTPLPIIWMLPKDVNKFVQYPNYNCPLYKTTERRGVLSTTGHSTNFVLDVRLPTRKDPAHWTKRGVALMTSLND